MKLRVLASGGGGSNGSERAGQSRGRNMLQVMSEIVWPCDDPSASGDVILETVKNSNS